jgi:hypothetical protein
VIFGNVTTEQTANGGRAIAEGNNQAVANGGGSLIH